MRTRNITGALVTGTGAPPGLGVLRSLREAFPDMPLAAADASPFAAGLFEPGATGIMLPSANELDAYRGAVRRACEAHGLNAVIACSEAEAAALAPVARDFEQAGIAMPLPDPEVLAFGIDKGRLLTRMAEAGLPHPDTLQPSAEADLARWTGGFPCVLKPRRSRGARGVSYPRSAEELARLWAQTAPAHGDCVVQRYIEGGPETVYTVGALYDRGALMVSTLHRKLATNPPSGGVAIAGETMIDPAVTEAGLKVLEATGPWHGLVAVELKRPAPGEPAYVLEINPRMWGFGYLMTLAGLNVPALLIRMLNGEFGPEGVPEDQRAYAPTRAVRSWADVIIPSEAAA